MSTNSKEDIKCWYFNHRIVASERQHNLESSFFASYFFDGLHSGSLKQDAVSSLFLSDPEPLKQHGFPYTTEVLKLGFP